MSEGRFASVCSVEEFILRARTNKNTAQKTEQNVRLIGRFLKTKNEDRKVEDIPAVELNEYLSSPSALMIAQSTSKIRFED